MGEGTLAGGEPETPHHEARSRQCRNVPLDLVYGRDDVGHVGLGAEQRLLTQPQDLPARRGPSGENPADPTGQRG